MPQFVTRRVQTGTEVVIERKPLYEMRTVQKGWRTVMRQVPRYEMRKVQEGWRTVSERVPRYETRRVRVGTRRVAHRVTEWVTRRVWRPIRRWIPGLGRITDWIRERVVEPVTRWVTRSEPVYEKRRVQVGWKTVTKRVPNMVTRKVQVGWDKVTERVPNMVEQKVLVGYDVTKKVVPLYKDVTVQEGYKEVEHVVSKDLLRFLALAWRKGQLKEALASHFGPEWRRRVIVWGGTAITLAAAVVMLGGCRELINNIVDAIIGSPSTPTPTTIVIPTMTPVTLTPTMTATITPTTTVTPTPGVLLPSDGINLIQPGDNAASICRADLQPVRVNSDGSTTPLGQLACQDYFEFASIVGQEPTYQELAGMLVYNELESISSTFPGGFDCQAYLSSVEAFGRQYYQISGGDGRFDSYEEMFMFLGGIEGWYGHDATEFTTDARYPLSWVYQGITTGELPPEAGEFAQNFGVPNMQTAYGIAEQIWDSDNGWSEGYVCGQPARWGNTNDLSIPDIIEFYDTPGGGDYDYYIIQEPPGCP